MLHDPIRVHPNIPGLKGQGDTVPCPSFPLLGRSRTSGRRTSGPSRPSLEAQVLAVFSFISQGKPQLKKCLEKRLEVPGILLPDIRGLLKIVFGDLVENQGKRPKYKGFSALSEPLQTLEGKSREQKKPRKSKSQGIQEAN